MKTLMIIRSILSALMGLFCCFMVAGLGFYLLGGGSSQGSTAQAGRPRKLIYTRLA